MCLFGGIARKFQVNENETKRTQTKANEHETNRNEQMGGLFCFVRKYPPNAPTAFFFLFFDPPLFFLVNFLTTDAEMKTKCTPRYSFCLT